ncbi:unnamed protein product [Prunus armeniaca]|uniref:At1g61320/AtMIF1 LRR domain-containing protein n=1 Tax=Prunus armeniaca TaxID=36596 RepID=A0A6J5WXE6_PRUAR|nr:unnamed protein product [Prunus armeniaca]
MFPVNKTRRDTRKVVYGPPLKQLRTFLRPVVGSSSSHGSSRSRSVQLTDDLIEYIFTLLPIKAAVKAGLVARRFRDSWRLTRRIHFEKELAEGYDNDKLETILNHVFESHRGDEIKSFRLHFDPNAHELHLPEWVRKCIQKRVQELDLDISQPKQEPSFPLPPRFLDVESLKVLKLSYSVFQLPPDIKGLSLLTTLVLRRVDITPKIIQTILDRCALLETLDMGQCHGFRLLRIHAQKQTRLRVLKVGNCRAEVRVIEIDAPSVGSLYYSGSISNFRVISQSLLFLKEAMLYFKPLKGITNPLQVERLASSISNNVELLTITSTFLEGLSPRIVDGVLREKQVSFRNLKELQLIMENPSYCNAGDIASFLKNCPRLEKLFIDADEFTFDGGAFYELHQKPLLDKHSALFKHLKLIKIMGFRFQPCHLDLTRFLLGKAMSLEYMFLLLPKSFRFSRALSQDMDFFTDAFLSWKLSPDAEISIGFAWEDKSFVYPKQSRSWY